MSSHTIAVLPFINKGADPTQEYFSDGITESIMTLLAKVAGFRVTSRMSSFAFKGQTADIREIGARLGVQYVLEGSVQTAGKRVRISVQLTETDSRFQVWGELFNRELEDVFEVQDEIAASVAAQLEVTLRPKKVRPKAPTSLPEHPTENLQAYSDYLKGLFFFNKHNPPDGLKAIEFLESAVQKDPEFAAAYVALANAHFYVANWGYSRTQEAYPKARALAKKAQALNPSLTGAYLTLALVDMYLDLDWAAAKIHFQRAFELNTDLPNLYRNYATYLLGLRRIQEAIDYIQKALEYDPLSLRLSNYLSFIYIINRDFDAAIAQNHRSLELDPNYRQAYEGLGVIYALKGEFDRAIAYSKQYKKMVNHPLRGTTILGWVYAKSGNREKADECLALLKKRKQLEPNTVLHSDFASLYAGMGEVELAMDHIEKAFGSRMGLIYYLLHPNLDSVRHHPRYKRLMQQFTFPSEETDTAKPRLFIQPETKEVLEIFAEDFLYAEAQDNYTKVVWQQNGQINEKLMRMMLKNLEIQLGGGQIVRCHRSYLVNLDHRFETKGNARGYRLCSKSHDFEVPISRSLASEILTAVKD